MKLRKKFTSVLALTMALSMLLSSAAYAAEAGMGEDSSVPVEDSYVEELPDAAETDAEAPAGKETEDADPNSSEAEPPAEEPQEEPAQESVETPEAEEPQQDAEPAEEPEDEEPGAPELMAADSGWVAKKDSSGQVRYTYTYYEGTAKKVAGEGVTGENEFQVLLVPKEDVKLPDGTTRTLSKKYYLFQDGYWKETMPNPDTTDTENPTVPFTPLNTGKNEEKKPSNAARYKKIGVITLNSKTKKYELTETYSYRMLTVKGGIGTIYSGLFYSWNRDDAGNLTSEKDKTTRCRYDDGVGRGGSKGAYALGTDTPHSLFWYVDGYYLKDASVTVLKKGNDGCKDGWTKYKDKWYCATEKSIKNCKAEEAGASEDSTCRLYPKDKKVYKYTKGKASLFTGKWKNPADKIVRHYEKGVPLAGWVLSKDKSKLYCYVDGRSDSSAAVKKLKEDDGFRKYNKKWYHYDASDKKDYMALANNVYRTVKKKLYKYTKGVAALFTGTYKGKYYVKGVLQSYNGWERLNTKWYYFKDGAPVTGWQYLKRNGKTYKYFFKDDGVLVEDLFAYFGKSYLGKKMLVQINRTTHTADLLLWDSGKDAYCIAAKSFVCSTCEKSGNFKAGTYNLRKTWQGRGWRRRWFEFTHPQTHLKSYFQYATFILKTNAWIHSPAYSKKKINTLRVGNYNKLGTNQSFYCVRFQTVNTKYVYDSVGKVGIQRCKLYRSGNKGPFGKMTLANCGGKLKKGTKYDPTDPARK